MVENYELRCGELSSKLGRILRLMKLTGFYYGSTTLHDDPEVFNSPGISLVFDRVVRPMDSRFTGCH